MTTLAERVEKLEQRVNAVNKARLDVVMPSREQAALRFEELADAVEGIEGARALAGYHRITIGGLTIQVTSSR